MIQLPRLMPLEGEDPEFDAQYAREITEPVPSAWQRASVEPRAPHPKQRSNIVPPRCGRCARTARLMAFTFSEAPARWACRPCGIDWLTAEGETERAHEQRQREQDARVAALGPMPDWPALYPFLGARITNLLVRAWMWGALDPRVATDDELRTVRGFGTGTLAAWRAAEREVQL